MRVREGIKFIFTAAILFSIVHIEQGLASHEISQTETDGFKYHKISNPIEALHYSQMWYFNFIDIENDLSGVVGVGVLNPDQRLLPIGQTSTMVGIVRAPQEGDSFYIWDRIYGPKKRGQFFASKTFEPRLRLQLINPSLAIKVISKDQYRLRGSMQDEQRIVSFNLTYSRVKGPLGAGWIPWKNIELPKILGVLDARVTYTMQMPNALVNGTMTISDLHSHTQKKYTIQNARGYHDGYYGSASLIPTFKWDWLNYQQDDLAIQMLNPHGPIYKCSETNAICTPGNLRVVVNEGAFEFLKNEISIQYNEMKVDPEFPSVPYPTDTSITAIDKDGNRLELRWKAKQYIKVFYNPPKPLKNLPTFEIVADMTGNFFSSKTGLTYPIAGFGWADYSDNPK